MWGVDELPHANRHIRQESPRECLWKNIATSIAAVQHRQPQHITMFGPFRLTNPLSGGLLWCDSLHFPGYLFAQLLVFAVTFSTPMHSLLSPARYLDMNTDKTTGKYHGASLDDTALRRMGQSMKKVERWKMEMPTEQEMLPKDKYTVFDRKVKRYRKGIHSKSDMASLFSGVGLGWTTG